MYVVSMSMEPISSLLHFGKKRGGKYFPKLSSCDRKEIKFHIAQQRANNPERDPVTGPVSFLMGSFRHSKVMHTLLTWGCLPLVSLECVCFHVQPVQPLLLWGTLVVALVLAERPSTADSCCRSRSGLHVPSFWKRGSESSRRK